MPILRSPGCHCTCGTPGTITCNQCTNGLIPATLTLTDANTTITLTWVPASSAWNGCYTITQSGRTLSGANCVTATVTVAVQYGLLCPLAGGGSPNKFQLIERWTICSAATPTVGGPGTCNANGQATVASGSTAVQQSITFFSATVAPNCRPLALTFTVTGANVNGTVTITE